MTMPSNLETIPNQSLVMTSVMTCSDMLCFKVNTSKGLVSNGLGGSLPNRIDLCQGVSPLLRVDQFDFHGHLEPI